MYNKMSLVVDLMRQATNRFFDRNELQRESRWGLLYRGNVHFDIRLDVYVAREWNFGCTPHYYTAHYMPARPHVASRSRVLFQRDQYPG